MKNLILLSLGIALPGLALAQESSCQGQKASSCQSQTSTCQEPKANESLLTSAELTKIVAAAEKGCATSQARLTAIKKACGTECSQELAKKVAQMETSCQSGCPISKSMLTSLKTAGVPQEPVKKEAVKTAKLSDEVAQLVKYSENGCAASAEKVAALKKACSTECSQELLTKIQKLETGCSQGCEQSKAQLTSLQDIVKGQQAKQAKKVEKVEAKTLSEEVAQLVNYSENGCAASTLKVAWLKKACDTECSQELLTKIKTLESNCDHGCAASKAQLTSLREILKAQPAKQQKVEKAEKTEKVETKTLSEEVAQLVKYSENGCAASTAKLTSLKNAAHTECCQELLTKIKTLESNCAHGCAASKAQLTSLRQAMTAKKQTVRL
ncbi:MAG: hypothetical protein H6834_06955 [Planctomycetes bacterium]|nr:hypothetical protein [Planctomycetota bacterium]